MDNQVVQEGFVSLTEEQIADLKKQHGRLYHLELEEGKQCWLKSPSRKTISYASKSAITDPLKFAETVLNNCWICGDEEIKTDDTLFMSIAGKIDEIIETQQVTLKKY